MLHIKCRKKTTPSNTYDIIYREQHNTRLFCFVYTLLKASCYTIYLPFISVLSAAYI